MVVLCVRSSKDSKDRTLVRNCQRSPIMTVLWEGSIEVSPTLLALLVATRVLVLTVIGVAVGRAKAELGRGAMGIRKLTMLPAHLDPATNRHTVVGLNNTILLSPSSGGEKFSHRDRVDSA